MVLKLNLEPQSHFSPASRWTCCPVLSLEGPGSQCSRADAPSPPERVRPALASSSLDLACIGRGGLLRFTDPQSLFRCPFLGPRAGLHRPVPSSGPAPTLCLPHHRQRPPQAGRGGHACPGSDQLCAHPQPGLWAFSFPIFTSQSLGINGARAHPFQSQRPSAPTLAPWPRGERAALGLGVELTGGRCLGKGATASLSLSALCASWGPPGGPGASVGAIKVNFLPQAQRVTALVGSGGTQRHPPGLPPSTPEFVFVGLFICQLLACGEGASGLSERRRNWQLRAPSSGQRPLCAQSPSCRPATWVQVRWLPGVGGEKEGRDLSGTPPLPSSSVKACE